MQLVMNSPAQTCALASPGESSSARARLLAAVHEATDALVHGQATSSATGGAEPDTRFSELLRLLTYCYANGIYASADIEMALSCDAVLHHLANGRHHRVGRDPFFSTAAPTHTATLPGPRPCSQLGTGPLRPRPLGSPAVGLLLGRRCDEQALTPNFEEEAADRMLQAICTDTALLDE
jgi:hypothetical protein